LILRVFGEEVAQAISYFLIRTTGRPHRSTRSTWGRRRRQGREWRGLSQPLEDRILSFGQGGPQGLDQLVRFERLAKPAEDCGRAPAAIVGSSLCCLQGSEPLPVVTREGDF